MSKRPPSTPPVISGFEYIKLLGSGGFADVFLYQQLHPRRQVAVKVLLKERLGSQTAQSFTDEANLMAQLATHPSIVSVYQAGVAGDGRPYLVMEYCSRPNLQVRHRREKFSEAETLRVGIQIASAVETAHRAGILHRDIKPANILVTEYNRPALTDFGISATTTSEMAGLSVPWSPPEAFRTPPEGYRSSDVYSLAATLYTLLTNRSPFELAGASNSEMDLVSRIETLPLPPTGRPDVSPNLEAVLARAMAKNPAQRYQTALEFAHALQRVQGELGMQPTPVDVIEDEIETHRGDDDDDDRTRFRSITSIDAQSTTTEYSQPTPTVPLPGAAPGTQFSAAPVSDATVMRPRGTAPQPAQLPAPDVPDLTTTIHRAPAPVQQEEVPTPTRHTGLIVGGVVGALVLVGAVVAALLLTGEDPAAEPTQVATSAAPIDAIVEDSVPTVTELTGVVEGEQAVFTWTNPDPLEGDSYLWRQVIPGQEFTFEETTENSVTLDADESGRTCIEVVLRRANGKSAVEGVEACTP